MVEIIKILKNTPAELLNLKSGDLLVSINGNKINDKLDFIYFVQAEELVLEIKREEELLSYKIEENMASNETEFGLVLADYQIKNCGNNCLFCFVHQNPQGLRKTLYVKDEDYRFSFLYGSYFTLTNISQEELERIVKMHLSPLYISVHATDPVVRKKLLGLKRDDNFMEKLTYLTSNGIQLHTQIVLCPGLNDQEILKKTVDDLAKLYPQIASVAVVPLGKTKHRKNLPELDSITPEKALEVITDINLMQAKMLDSFETRFVFAADEFYLRANQEIPETDYYEGFEQYENGVGLVRSFMDELSEFQKKIPKKLKKRTKLIMVTGRAFAPVLEKTLSPILDKITNLEFQIVAVTNQLFGEEVTVAGLLCGRDILSGIETIEIASDDLLILPPTCLNYDKLFLDDMSFEEFKIKARGKVEQFKDVKSFFGLLK